MNAPSGFSLYRPRAVLVEAEAGRPLRVSHRRVDAIREEWLVEDRWWTRSPLRRHYFELVLDGGRCLTVFHDLQRGGWFEQRA